ncbi:MAG: hypothetical protein A2521_10580 [Deltaproteobacteria bacterium RIFOXYD12_FULL_57_12]|nr:MAG: hypothetical protein A2521_10580 [Deltaproteobacteria bacterium RIFOXYD12_FULL_57_12]
MYGQSVTGNGNVSVVGNDNCGVESSVPAIAFDLGQSLCCGGSVSATSSAGATIDLPAPLDIAGRVASLTPSQTDVITADANNLTYGSATDYRTVYCDATVLSPDQELDLNGLTGYGILIVKGDLDLGGNLNWHGLIIVSGNVSMHGGGSDAKNVLGAVMAQTTSELQGKVTVNYDSCEIAKASKANTTFTVNRWLSR